MCIRDRLSVVIKQAQLIGQRIRGEDGVKSAVELIEVHSARFKEKAASVV